MSGPDEPSTAAAAGAEPGSGSIIPLDELEHTEHSHELVGAEHGNVSTRYPRPLCAGCRTQAPPPSLRGCLRRRIRRGDVPARRRDDRVRGGHVVVGLPDVPHGFTNSGTAELRLTAIHGAGHFDTEWLAGLDPTWTSRPRD